MCGNPANPVKSVRCASSVRPGKPQPVDPIGNGGEGGHLQDNMRARMTEDGDSTRRYPTSG